MKYLVDVKDAEGNIIGQEWQTAAETVGRYNQTEIITRSGRKYLQNEKGVWRRVKAVKPNPNSITAEEFDKKFDNSEDISAHIEWEKIRVRPKADQKE